MQSSMRTIGLETGHAELRTTDKAFRKIKLYLSLRPILASGTVHKIDISDHQAVESKHSRNRFYKIVTVDIKKTWLLLKNEKPSSFIFEEIIRIRYLQKN